MDAVFANAGSVGEYLKHAGTLLDEVANTEESAVRGLRRLNMQVRARTAHPSLHACFAALGHLLEALCVRSDNEARAMRDAAKQLASFRQRFRDATKAREKRFSDLRKAYEAALAERDRARREHETAAETLLTLNHKMSALERDESAKKSTFFTKSPYELTKAKVENAQRELEKAQRTLVRKEEALLQATAQLRSETGQILKACLEDERARTAWLKHRLTLVVTARQAPLAAVEAAAATLDATATRVDNRADLLAVLAPVRADPVPEVVRVDVAAMGLAERAQVEAMLATCATVAADRAAEEQVKLHYSTAARLQQHWQPGTANAGNGALLGSVLSLAALGGTFSTTAQTPAIGRYHQPSSTAASEYGGTTGAARSPMSVASRSLATAQRALDSAMQNPVVGVALDTFGASGATLGRTVGSAMANHRMRAPSDDEARKSATLPIGAHPPAALGFAAGAGVSSTAHGLATVGGADAVGGAHRVSRGSRDLALTAQTFAAPGTAHALSHTGVTASAPSGHSPAVPTAAPIASAAITINGVMPAFPAAGTAPPPVLRPRQSVSPAVPPRVREVAQTRDAIAADAAAAVSASPVTTPNKGTGKDASSPAQAI
jgi:chemotaxis protein histidine kinase CheA